MEPALQMSSRGLAVQGELTRDTVPGLWPASRSLLAGLSRQQIWEIDLSSVSHADSAGVALLLEWQRLCLDQGTELRLCAVPPHMMDLIELSNLRAVFNIDDGPN